MDTGELIAPKRDMPRCELTGKSTENLRSISDRLAVHCTVEELEHDLRTLPYEPYAPVPQPIAGHRAEPQPTAQSSGLAARFNGCSEIAPRPCLRLRLEMKPRPFLNNAIQFDL